MTDEKAASRRTVLRTTGLALAGASLAGCLGAQTDEDDQRTATATGTPTATPDGDGGGGDGGDGGGGNDDVASYLDGANGYDGSVVDETGAGELTVMVGAGNGLAFGPAAVRVSTGTTVTWEWTGQGGQHNVVHEEGAFDSGDPATEPEPFSHTFEEAGTYLYYCNPHKTVGMRGAVVVE